MMEAANWSGYVRMYRTRHGIKQEELAGVVGLRQASISRWEHGCTVPEHCAQHRYRMVMEDYAAKIARQGNKVATEASSIPATLRILVHVNPMITLMDGNSIVLVAGPLVRAGFLKRGENASGFDISPYASENFHSVVREWRREILTPGSPLLSVSYDDISILNEGRLVRRTWTAADIGEGRRLYLNSDVFLEAPPHRDLPPTNVSLLTTDDL